MSAPLPATRRPATNSPNPSHVWLALPLLLAGAASAGDFAASAHAERSTLPESLAAAPTVTFERAGESIEMRFTPWSLRTPTFRLLVQTSEKTVTEVAPPPPHTLRGQSIEHPRVIAAGSIDARTGCEPGLRGVITLDGETWAVECDAGGQMMRSMRDVSFPIGACAALGAVNGPQRPDADGGVAGATCPRVCEIAFDADYEYFLINGSSVEATVADIESILAGLVPIFEAAVETTFALTAIIVRTTPDDPYSSKDWMELMQEVRAEWTTNLSAIPRDIAHLMTDKTPGSVLGAAWVTGLCDFEFQYGWSKSQWSEAFAERVFLTAHEVGHNFGASHDCGQPDCGIMCGPSCSTTQFSALSLAQINNHLDSTTCLTEHAPDLDGDCTVGASDLGILLAAWGTPGPGDLDGDGTVGSSDLGVLLAAWSG